MKGLADAVRPQDFFGEDATFEEAQRKYRQCARDLHPDHLPANASSEQRAESTEEFMKLTKLWEIARALFAGGHWKDPGLAGLTVKSKKRTHIIGARLERGDIADIYTCGSGIIKIARSPRDGDLMRQEVTAIKKIRRATETDEHVYLPRLADALRVKDSSRIERQANVFDANPVFRPEHAGQWVTLKDVISAYPFGLDPRDAAWMWRRMLVSIGTAHDAGIIHNAPFPEHFMILPPEHGVVLVDWCYSTEEGMPPVAIIPRYREWYPEEVISKSPSQPESDIAIVARTMIAVLGGDPVTCELPTGRVPRGLRSYFRACTLKSAKMRSGDARRLLHSFDELIEALWGPRKFREFKMPAGVS